MDHKKTKQILFLIAFGVILFVGLSHLDVVLGLIYQIGIILLPFLLGAVIAFILNVPVKGFEGLLSRAAQKVCRKHPPKDSLITCLSIFLTVLCILLVVVLFCTMMVPELVSSVKSVYALLEKKWPLWIERLSHVDFDTSAITDWMKTINVEKLINSATGSIGSVLNSVMNIAASSISAIITTCFAVVIAFYMLADKKNLSRQCRKLLSANLSEKTTEKLISVANITSNTYSKFLSGQCMEAILLGVLIYLAFLVFRLPYAGLIAVMTAIFALIPYIGAFLSCFIGAFLTLISNPSQVLLCIIVYLAVQFVENQFIYPHVVGGFRGAFPAVDFGGGHGGRQAVRAGRNPIFYPPDGCYHHPFAGRYQCKTQPA